jgi:transaldolase/glucose-6-phosphate isomerase
MNRSVDYRKRGQAVWLDSISARMIATGELAGRIEAGAIYGVTSNPTIFAQAIGRSDGDYEPRIVNLTDEEKDTFEIYDELTRGDIAAGADLFAAQHAANPEDGWISLEVLPNLAFDIEGTIAEAKRLHRLLGRPNVFIKVPATPAGCVAIRTLIGSGVSVNVTLMFNRKHYRDVAHAYQDGVAAFVAAGGDPSKVASVASFFVSRVDTLVDKLLAEKAHAAPAPLRARLEALRGKAALANAKVVYQDYLAAFGTGAWKALAAKGARVQRPLWASTGTKNPAYSDLLYVENLVGPDTVNTLPEKTLEALLDHGRDLGDTVLEGIDEAKRTLDQLRELGLDVEALGEKLQGEGIVSFEKSYEELLGVVEERRHATLLESARTVRIRPE